MTPLDCNTNDLNPAPWPVLASHCPPGLLVGFAAVAPNAAPHIPLAAVTFDFPSKSQQVAPLTAEEGEAIVRRFERMVADYNRLFNEYQGKAMSDDVYQRFAAMRDERLPAMRRELVQLLAGKSIA